MRKSDKKVSSKYLVLGIIFIVTMVLTFLSMSFESVTPSATTMSAAGDTVTFDQVLFVNNGEAKVGDPTVAGATVTASVVEEGKDKKVIVYKYKRKTGYHKKNGHRQLFTKVKIEKINA